LRKNGSDLNYKKSKKKKRKDATRKLKNRGKHRDDRKGTGISDDKHEDDSSSQRVILRENE
jgi:hypothetical protein